LDCAILIHEYLLPAAGGVWYCCDPNVVPDNSELEDIHLKRTLALLVICALFITAAPLGAHHSTAMYTGTKTVTGKVLKFEWTNPHAHVYVETKDEKTGRTKKSQIFPRYHQLDVVRELLADAADKGAGRLNRVVSGKLEYHPVLLKPMILKLNSPRLRARSDSE
jgi:hypothetical protein